MSKKVLAGLFLLSSYAAATAGEADRSSRAESLVKTDFDQACFGAIAQMPSHYGDRNSEPFSEMAIALIKRCNANPDSMPCEVASKVTMREYGKTPFACGVDTVYTGPVILLPDTK
jgi:hypothetical protein